VNLSDYSFRTRERLAIRLPLDTNCNCPPLASKRHYLDALRASTRMRIRPKVGCRFALMLHLSSHLRSQLVNVWTREYASMLPYRNYFVCVWPRLSSERKFLPCASLQTGKSKTRDRLARSFTCTIEIVSFCVSGTMYACTTQWLRTNCCTGFVYIFSPATNLMGGREPRLAC
jgi:hypothetical protein